jgi:predicted RNase H-like HicB family nuclease
MSKYTVNARWDDETKSWWTDGEDIPGLCCQADSFEELIEAILALAPELLRDNATEPLGQTIDIKIVGERHAATCIAA